MSSRWGSPQQFTIAFGRQLCISSRSMSFRPSSLVCASPGLFGTATFPASLRIPIERLFGGIIGISSQCVINTVPLATLDLMVDRRFRAAPHMVFVRDFLSKCREFDEDRYWSKLMITILSQACQKNTNLNLKNRETRLVSCRVHEQQRCKIYKCNYLCVN